MNKQGRIHDIGDFFDKRYRVKFTTWRGLNLHRSAPTVSTMSKTAQIVVYDPVYNMLLSFPEHLGDKMLIKVFYSVISACHAHVTICIIEIKSIKNEENRLRIGSFSFNGNPLGGIQKMTPIGGH